MRKTWCLRCLQESLGQFRKIQKENFDLWMFFEENLAKYRRQRYKWRKSRVLCMSPLQYAYIINIPNVMKRSVDDFFISNICQRKKNKLNYLTYNAIILLDPTTKNKKKNILHHLFRHPFHKSDVVLCLRF